MIEIKDLNKTYGKIATAVLAVKDVSLTIKQGEFIAVMGASGSGKSTLLHIMGLLDRPDSGSYKIFGKEVSNLSNDSLANLRNKLIGFVFQQFHLLSRTSARENVELPLIYSGRDANAENVLDKLSSVGLSKRVEHLPNELSGGEQQRVAIARALVNEPMVILADEPTGNLDTKSEEEIIKIFNDLNDSGKTVILVTHDNEVAKHAKRIITMRDGKIISDKEQGPHKEVIEDDKAINAILKEKPHSYFDITELAGHIRQSYRAITSNKVRSFLSMLGILFGVAAVIAMLALGQGATRSMEERLKTLGSNLLSIRGGSAKVRGVAKGSGSVTRFTLSDVSAIESLKPLVKKVSGQVSGSGQLVYKSENWSTNVQGVGYDYGTMRATVPEIGRWFTKNEIKKREKVAVVGYTVVDKLFGDKNPVGEMIKINRLNFRIVGVAPEKGAGGWRDQDDVVYIPLTTAMYRVFGKDYLDSIYAEISDVGSTAEAQDRIEQLIIKRHRIYSDDEDSFYIRDMSEIQDMLTSTTKTMSLLLGCIAAISLLVGGIGIMNIMLVSVTERTREIGLRKAIGARGKDIMAQFLIEAIIMTLSGGFIGIVVGVLVAVILSLLAGWATKVTGSSIILATGFSIAVGIFFGLWPAKKASELNPIEALRYE